MSCSLGSSFLRFYEKIAFGLQGRRTYLSESSICSTICSVYLKIGKIGC
jgi:hypothetical protein